MTVIGNLLARIHGDGGHYQSEHGMTKAIIDAETVVCKLRQENARLQQELDFETRHFKSQAHVLKLQQAIDAARGRAIDILRLTNT